MISFEHHCVKHNDTILLALAKLDKLSWLDMVVFVLNDKGQVVGTLTDGDIRRALLRGLN
ncbi:CBS domain-containing protein, partial [Parabacteroides distasonis]